jgi:hypothetical protein
LERSMLDVFIEQVIGPRLESRKIVVETVTSSGQVALRLSQSAAASLNRALVTALRAGDGTLPEFLRADGSELGSAPASRKRLPRLSWLARRRASLKN